MSNQNIRTRWTHPSFDSNSLFAPCDNLSDILHVLRDVRTERLSAPQRLVRSQRFVSHRVSLRGLSLFRHCFLGGLLICCSAQSMQPLLCGGKPCLTMEASDTSSTYSCSSLLTSPDSEEYDEHNVWNPVLNLFCHKYGGAIMESYLD